MSPVRQVTSSQPTAPPREAPGETSGGAPGIPFAELACRLPQPVLFKDRALRIRFANPAAAALLGQAAPGDPIGKKLSDLLGGEAAGEMEARDAAALAGGEDSGETPEAFPSTDGKTAWFQWLRAADPGGEGLWLIAREVTEERETEERLVALNADLFAALADLKNAHAELRGIQAHLIEAEKMHSIGRLAASVAHEVKNPLAIIRMRIECFAQERDAGDPSTSMVLGEMTDAVKRADSVIRGLLDFAAPARMSPDDCSLNEIVERALQLVRGEVAARKCQVSPDLDPDLPPARLDRLKISQVFVNLFLNALHAMGPGGELRVRTFSKRVSEGREAGRFPVGCRIIVAEVCDSGPGIPQDCLGRVFEPFYTTKPTGEGSGLGLTVSKSIVELHGGTLELGNREGGGARAALLLRASDG